jgi:hypothetical protein
MSSAIEYLKQEEANGRVEVSRAAEEAVNAVRDANFWAEVNRIRTNGGWRAEEGRISLGNGILTAEQQAELDREAKELIRVRKELLEKKKQVEQQKKDDERRVRELLLSEPALSWKMRVSPNGVAQHYDHNNGYGTLVPWNPSEGGRSAKEMLDAYAEIQEFRTSSIPIIKSAIKKAMDDLWEDTTDDRILQREHIQNSGGSGWGYDSNTVHHALGTVHKQKTDMDWWKCAILIEVGVPLYKEEWNKWLFYCKKFIERSKGKPRLDESLRNIEQLQEKLVSLTKRNELLEEKMVSIRSITHF